MGIQLQWVKNLNIFFLNHYFLTFFYIHVKVINSISGLQNRFICYLVPKKPVSKGCNEKLV